MSTDASGKANFTHSVPTVTAGRTVTATDPNRDTSEFSAPRAVVAQ